MKKPITIKLYLGMLYYDIRNKAWLTGRSRDTGQNREQVAHMQASDEESESDVVMRSIAQAISELKTALHEYLVINDDTESNLPHTAPAHDSREAVTLILAMPENFNEAATSTVAEAAHGYIVEKSLADWFLITNKADAPDYATRAVGKLATIREAINKRVRPVRPQ